MQKISVYDNLSEVRGVGSRYLEKFNKAGIETVGDLLRKLPNRYEDFSNVLKIRDLKINESATIQGTVKSIKIRRGFHRYIFIIEALISDDTGSIRAVWFNQRFLLKAIPEGTVINLAGKIYEQKKGGVYFYNPIFELVNKPVEIENENEDDDLPIINLIDEEVETKHTARIVPIYSESRGLTSKVYRFIIKKILNNLESAPDPIPSEILKDLNFPEVNTAFEWLHFPETITEAKKAKKRFAFEDLFLLQLVNLKNRKKLEGERAHSLKIDLEKVKEILNSLPFELTHSQKSVLWEIIKDLEKTVPMNRLLQGDVGSGKTIVAALAAYFTALSGKQAAFMAPTEVLANQHYRTIKKFFSDFEGGLGILTSSEAKVFYGKNLESKVKKADFLRQVEKGEIKIIIGTHALIVPKKNSDKNGIDFEDLAFVVVDEQHRFGVKQRAALIEGQEKDKLLPHFLSMSATPIPRTLSLTLFGDLDLSIISELPKNRKAIITKVVSPENRVKAYAVIRGQVKNGRQVFVVCPRIEKNANEIEEGEFSYEAVKSEKPEIKSVKDEYEKLAKKVFPDLRVEMLHGKIKPQEKEEIMKKFSAGEIDVLVSTSVIEVGVDVPNASIMMIEGSERFGLAQLYQFKGRVGRGEHQSFCFLFTDSFSPATHERLNSIVNAKNGFELAEIDLAMRGPGEILGDSQTGMPDLAMKAIQNPELIKESRVAAEKILNKDLELKSYPLLRERLEKFVKQVHME